MYNNFWGSTKWVKQCRLMCLSRMKSQTNIKFVCWYFTVCLILGTKNVCSWHSSAPSCFLAKSICYLDVKPVSASVLLRLKLVNKGYKQYG